jgi:hypothetical protein
MVSEAVTVASKEAARWCSAGATCKQCAYEHAKDGVSAGELMAAYILSLLALAACTFCSCRRARNTVAMPVLLLALLLL